MFLFRPVVMNKSQKTWQEVGEYTQVKTFWLVTVSKAQINKWLRLHYCGVVPSSLASG